MTTYDQDMEAEFYVKQVQEWMKICPVEASCPAAMFWRCMISQSDKIKRLEYELKVMGSSKMNLKGAPND